MSRILQTNTEHITTPLADEGNYAYCQSRGAHNIKHIEPMEISIERSPPHWCPNEGSNSELFDHKNDTLTARPQKKFDKVISQSTKEETMASRDHAPSGGDMEFTKGVLKKCR